MVSGYCTGEHHWEPGVLKDYGERYGCKVCQALGKLEGDRVVVVKRTDCEKPAITLNDCEAGKPAVPVCEYCFTGVILR